MEHLVKDIKEISRRMMTEKGQYYRDTTKYLNSIMRSAKQEDLMDVFPKLDIHELKRCIAAGVPGHAMHAANEILAIKKDELRHFEVEQIGKIKVQYEDETVEEKDKDELETVAHLKADEKAICKRWVRAIPIQGKREFDVHLDTPTLHAPAWWTKKDMANWDAVTAKRIDMVVHANDAIWIMEVTPKVSKAAVGGCLTYKELYEKQFKPSKPVKMGIICEFDDVAYHPILKNLDIRLWIV